MKPGCKLSAQERKTKETATKRAKARADGKTNKQQRPENDTG